MIKPRKAAFLLAAMVSLAVAMSAWNINRVAHVQGESKTLSATNVQIAVPIRFDSLQKQHDTNGLVAHAFGTIDGESYTNSIEAFEESYKKGFRLFEVDFMPLKDDVITAHDLHEPYFGLDKTFPEYTKNDLKNKKYSGKYTPLFSEEFIELVRSYPDVQVILDTKTDHQAVVSRLVEAADGDRAVLNRLIPHISDQQNYDEIMAVYRFPQTMLALYRLLPLQAMNQEEIIAYIHKNNMTAVMMNIKEDDATLATIGNDGTGIFSFEKIHQALNAARIPHYVHSAKTEQDVMKFRSIGVGVYSDGIWPK